MLDRYRYIQRNFGRIQVCWIGIGMYILYDLNVGRRHIKMTKSKYLLISTDMSIKKVAEQKSTIL